MEIRKGPFGHFAVESTGSSDFVFNYAREIIAENIPGHLLPVYINRSPDSLELSFDFSGLRPLNNCLFPKDLKSVNRFREAIGDLFLSFCSLPDFLLSPGNLVLDPNYMFTTDELDCIYVCLKPVKTEENSLVLSSIEKAGFKKFLTELIPSGIISSEDLDALTYAAQKNDEALFRKHAEELKKPKTQEVKSSGLIKSPEFKLSASACLLSLSVTMLNITIPGVLLMFASAVFLIKAIKQTAPKDDIKAKIRKADEAKIEMLFGDEEENPEAMGVLVLSSTNRNGEIERKSVYTQKACLGSDRFLCDILCRTKEFHRFMQNSKSPGISFMSRIYRMTMRLTSIT